jgi:hypothetical protein
LMQKGPLREAALLSLLTLMASHWPPKNFR